MMMIHSSTTDRAGKVAVIVLGMHRSGTSSLAGMLDGLGCRGPATLMPASETNAAGYYESMPVFRLNDAILAALESRWDDWRPLRPDAHRSPRLAEFHDEARTVLQSEYGDGSLIYLKDPRIGMLLPFWQKVLDAAGYRCVYLHTHRSPSEIAESLQRRDKIDPSLSRLAWLSQVLQAERHSRGQVRHFTSYEALLRDPTAVAEAAETAFGFPWPRRVEAGARRVNPALRHHDGGAGAAMEDVRIPGLIRQALEIFERWAAQGEQAADHTRLDEIAAAFTEAEGLFTGAMQALSNRCAELARAHANKEALEAQEAEKAALHARLTQATEDKAMLAEKLDHITEARDEALRERDAAREAQEAEKAALHARLTQATEDKATLAQKLDHITEARDEALRERDAAREAKAAAEAQQALQQQELDMLTDRLIDRDAALAAIRRETLKANRATETARQQLEQSRKKIKALTGQLKAQRQEFLSSTSWRVSAPVRILGRLIRRR